MQCTYEEASTEVIEVIDLVMRVIRVALEYDTVSLDTVQILVA